MFDIKSPSNHWVISISVSNKLPRFFSRCRFGILITVFRKHGVHEHTNYYDKQWNLDTLMLFLKLWVTYQCSFESYLLA